MPNTYEEGLIVSAVSPNANGEISGIELEVSSDLTVGAFIYAIGVNDVREAYAVTVTDSSVFDIAVSDITPLFKFGPVNQTVISTMRIGRDSSGGIIGNGAFILSASASLIAYLIPPGKFLSVRQRITNVSALCTLYFKEVG